MLKVGIVGYSKQKFDKGEAEAILRKVFVNLHHIRKKYELNDFAIEIVSGLTHMGIPGIAYDLAEEFGFKTVGIACNKANYYLCYPVDKTIIVGTNWGEESKTFMNYIDHLIRVGGGSQSHNEVQMARELGKSVEEYELPIMSD